jgi:ribosome-associated protein
MMNKALITALKAMDDKKAVDLAVMDIASVAAFADYFLLCSGDSSRQMQAIADAVEAAMAAQGYRPAHIEGYANAEWILLDYLDLVVHIFSKKARAYYDLERLWRDAKSLDVAGILEQAVPGAEPAPRSRKRKS